MKKLIWLSLLLVLSAPLAAQERPLAGTTVQTTDTTANSLLVGCTVGSTTCTGGIKAGPIAGSTGTFTGAVSTGALSATTGTFTGAVSGTTGTFTGALVATSAAFSGLFSDTAFGAHTITATGTGIHSLTVRNSSAGTGNASIVYVGNDTSATFLTLGALSSTWSTSGQYVQSGATIDSAGTGGISISASSGSGAIRFYAGNALAWGIKSTGDLTFGASSHIADSNGTPTITSGFGSGNSISGNDYAFIVQVGTTGGTAGGLVTFGHTFNTKPACIASDNVSGDDLGVTTTTTTVAIQNTTTWTGSTPVINILCRGY